MRTIHSHKVNPANERLSIAALDEPGPGGANHHYQIDGFDSSKNPSDPFVALYGEPALHSTILFQNGPIAADGSGINGVTHEALIAIAIDRLQAFQSGPFACRENALALTKLEEAKLWLFSRTLGRMARGVEGSLAP